MGNWCVVSSRKFPQIGAMNFNKYVQTGEAFVREIAVEVGCPDDVAKAGRVLRSVLHALRNQSTPEECFQLISQLPMQIKAVFVDGWRISGKGQRVRNIDDFIANVMDADGVSEWDDFPTEVETITAIKSVFRVIQKHVSEGEVEDFRRTLPEALRPLLR